MITCKQYIEWCKREKERLMSTGLFKSEITPLFKESDEPMYNWEFNEDNWNGGDIVRRYLYDNLYDIRIKGYEFYAYCAEDEWFLFILGRHDFYTVNWYKQRGRTQSITKSGQPITLGEYVELFNLIAPYIDLEVYGA